MMRFHDLIWIIPIAITVCVVSWMTRDYNIEAEKQNSFMMKACVDAGGAWEKNIGPTWNCVRPASARP